MARSDRLKLIRRMVATSVLWLGVVVLVFSGPGSPLSIALPDGYAYDVRPIEMTGGDLTADWQAAADSYRSAEYATAAQLFAELEQDADPAARHDARLYRGVSLLLSGQAAEARQVLETAQGIAEELGAVPAANHFYLGLASLAVDDVDTAVRCFDRARRGPFENDSQALLSALR